MREVRRRGKKITGSKIFNGYFYLNGPFWDIFTAFASPKVRHLGENFGPSVKILLKIKVAAQISAWSTQNFWSISTPT